jgi:hypothetical protein
MLVPARKVPENVTFPDESFMSPIMNPARSLTGVGIVCVTPPVVATQCVYSGEVKSLGFRA